MNMKKLFPESKGSRKGLLEFLDKKGFYIVLILCIAIVGATAVFVTTRNVTSSNQGYDSEKIIPEESAGDIVTDAAGDINAQAPIGNAASTEKKETAGNDTASASKDAGKQVVAQAENKTAQADKKTSAAQSSTTSKAASTSKTSTAKTAGAAQKQEFTVPVFGNVTFEYAQDKLLYSKTLEEWRAHSGIDIAAERGATVKAAADGVVTDIKNDPRFGVMIVIEHKNGLKTVYANLASNEMVTPNQKVKQGDIIGCVGNTAIFESAEESHLHFEVWKDNEVVNPTDYVKIVKN